MKIVMNNQQLAELIRKYQKEKFDFEGQLQLVGEQYCGMGGAYATVKAIMVGKMKLEGVEYDLIQEMDEDEIRHIIKYYVEKNGYRAGYMKFVNIVEKNPEVFIDKKPRLAFDNVEIEINQKVKKIGGV